VSSTIADAALQTRFRRVMGGVPTPVSVVTTLVEDQPHGTTVSAFTSLSMAPPMVLVALDATSDLLAQIQRSRRFGINVLGAGQADLALAFAKKGGTYNFQGIPGNRSHELPRLASTPGWLACEVADLVPGGDHVLVLGNVLAADEVDGHPLTYYRRMFGTHAVLAS
jgi:flavin reductase (DIM6/NTAB) family NADH-FMN oxidoreductase RutF